ncbi:p21-activated protein kinase-interacting protein 1-like isoform X1 [Haliotis rufescens]|uniref:p21-activated protein kinase-interacting protein 1-like isoform X1 n=2 Tax=Haliotis rufescens TaxID=6454 RepID=UPI00201FAD3A|nr:p21-activated protein kinase-interacting protein 1-like isoform X1 [Haliotis rufescens]
MTTHNLVEHMAEMESKELEVVVGTYEELILGYRLSLEPDNHAFSQSFTNHSHSGCIKALALSTKGILASGGTDEMVRVFNLRKGTEIGSLVHHSGTITWLDFYKNSHLFSTSEDHKMCLWKTFSWECLRTFKGHKDAVNCVAVHPSGKLALTVGKDRSLHTWNLVRGRSAYITNIKQAADIVLWSPDGTTFLIVFSNRIDVYKTETSSVYHSVSVDRRVNAVVFLRSNLIAYGGEGGDIVVYNIKDEKEMQRINTDTVRVRDLKKVKTTDQDCPLVLLSASSCGHIKAFRVTFSQDSVSADLIASHDTKFRLTCMAATQIKTKVKVKTEEEDVDVKTEDTIDLDDSIEIKIEKTSDEEEEEECKKTSGDNTSEQDSGHEEDSCSDSDSSREERSRKQSRSYLEFKRARKMKRKMGAEKLEVEGRKKKKPKVKETKPDRRSPKILRKSKRKS